VYDIDNKIQTPTSPLSVVDIVCVYMTHHTPPHTHDKNRKREREEKKKNFVENSLLKSICFSKN